MNTLNETDHGVEIHSEVDQSILTFDTEDDADAYALTGDPTLVASERPL